MSNFDTSQQQEFAPPVYQYCGATGTAGQKCKFCRKIIPTPLEDFS